MKSKEDIIRILAKDRSELEGRFKVRRIGLFGSYARGEQRPDSDVDILVDIDPSIGLEFVSLARRMEELLQLRVDLVSTRAIRPRCWQLIEQELIYV